ncbi:hypothetical protein T06_12954 [Trichinella sp. T6]|nr:hypothetical protein T06_12954 [Trichinella sp. T6]
MVVSTIGIQLIWTARLLDSQSKPTVDDIKVVNKINDRAHHDGMTATCKLFPHILASAGTQRQVNAFDKSLSAINCSARPEISRCTIFLLVRETKSTASCGPGVLLSSSGKWPSIRVDHFTETSKSPWKYDECALVAAALLRTSYKFVLIYGCLTQLLKNQPPFSLIV